MTLYVSRFTSPRNRNGQSLVELLVGTAIGVVFLIGAATIIAPSLQINKETTQIQAKTELANEMLDNIKAWAAGNWNNVLSVATGTANTYYLNTATSSFIVSAAGAVEPVTLGSLVYDRFFYVSDVYRNANGNVTTTAGSSYDPSTKLITVVVSVSSTAATPSTTLYFYLTRNDNNNFSQTSWVGGSGQGGPVTLTGSSYASSSNITVNASGSFQLASINTCIL